MKSSRNNSHIRIRFAALTLALFQVLGARVLEAGTTNTIGSTTLSSSSPLSIAAGNVTQSAGTLSMNANSSGTSICVTGPGTLQLVSTTNNSTTYPDIDFCSNDTPNSTLNYGCSITAPVDLGPLQRYIWGRTDHNGVDKYGLTAADCMFGGSISGSGGLTFIAQDSYTGSNPMETPFCLNAANSFTGPMEIQRGSVYLGAVGAFPAGNVLRFNVASGNNGRFFLYGKNAAVSDLSSTGAGTPLIANANRSPGNVAAATLTITENNPGTFSGNITNFVAEYVGSGGSTVPTLSLVKTGPAALTLSGICGYTGTTAVNGGKLYINNKSINGGGVTVANGATLGGSGVIVAAVTNANGSSIEAGDGTGSGTLTLKSLTLGSVSTDTSTLNLTRNSTPAIIAVTNNNGFVINSGAGKVTINVGGAAPAVGQYPLITYAGTLGGTGFSAFKLGTLPPRVVASLVNNTANHSIDLNVTAVDFPRWSGALSTEWSVNTLAAPKNWVLNSDGSTPVDYQNGDTVAFTDTATGTTVDVSVADVTPGGVTFNNSTKNFSLTGTKAITGTAGLTKTGTGTLTILNSNTYGGATTISGGTVQVGNGGTTGSLGTGSVTDNGALVFNRSDAVSVSGLSGNGNLQQNGSGTLSILGSDSHTGGTLISAGILQVGNGGAVTAFGNGPITNNSALVFNSSTISVAGVISGSGSVTNAAGTVTLNAANTYSGGTTVSAGSLVINDGSNIGRGFLTFSGVSQLTINGTSAVLTNNIVFGNVSGNITLLTPNNSSTIFNGTLSGGGPSTVLFFQGGATSQNTGSLTLNGTNTLAGTIDVERGPLILGNACAAGTAILYLDDNNPPTGALQLGGSFTISNSVNLVWNAVENIGVGSGITGGIAGTVFGAQGLNKVGAGTLVLSGTNTYAGPTAISAGTLQIGNGGTAGTFGGGSVTNNSVLVFNRSDALTVANAIGGTGAVIQNGTGAVALTGVNTYAGPTTVNAGSLVVNGSLTASSGVTVVSNATLSGSGTIASPINLSGALAPGAGGVGSLSTGPQTWNGGAAYFWEISSKTGTAGVNWDLLNVTGGINLQATETNPIIIKILPTAQIDFSKDAARSFTLATLTGTVTNFNPAAFVFDTTAFTTDLAGGYFFMSTNAGALVLNFVSIQPPAIASLDISSTNVLVNGMVRIVVQAT
ncbi:MAG: autotransporter-associated beta strand repeat-containing protein, partial [Verrucomicrobiota bacterium]